MYFTGTQRPTYLADPCVATILYDSSVMKNVVVLKSESEVLQEFPIKRTKLKGYGIPVINYSHMTMNERWTDHHVNFYCVITSVRLYSYTIPPVSSRTVHCT